MKEVPTTVAVATVVPAMRGTLGKVRSCLERDRLDGRPKIVTVFPRSAINGQRSCNMATHAARDGPE